MDNTKCTIVMYHYVRNLKKSRYPEIKGLDEQMFLDQIDYFEKNFNIITMETLLGAINKKNELPCNAIILTFDDGYIDHYNIVFPHLFNRGLQGSFFVTAAAIADNIVLDVNKIHFIIAKGEVRSILDEIYKSLEALRREGLLIESNDELRMKYISKRRYDDEDVVFIKSLLQYGLSEEIRNKITNKLFEKFVSYDEIAFSKELYMSYEQINLMKKCGMFFGIHGYQHYWLGKLGEEKMKNDILKALNYWENIIDKNNWVMNYPYGNYNDKVIEYIKNNGCVLGLTTDVSIVDLSSINSRYIIPRFDTNDFPPKSKKYLKME